MQPEIPLSPFEQVSSYSFKLEPVHLYIDSIADIVSLNELKVKLTEKSNSLTIYGINDVDKLVLNMDLCNLRQAINDRIFEVKTAESPSESVATLRAVKGKCEPLNT
ncbi:hypothetical protein AVEN_88210-1 [Araneus ventricosus]|uniref:Uncharacterized protein n=1 Tax=Araneus ventricosus TaxID=182803 RepID=A0A4Y2HWT4_ARAVE|nr:hypothetical protein AVEN_88210-1 [Araneus ventricosus]